MKLLVILMLVGNSAYAVDGAMVEQMKRDGDVPTAIGESVPEGGSRRERLNRKHPTQTCKSDSDCKSSESCIKHGFKTYGACIQSN